MSDTMLDHPGDDRDWSRLVDLAILENWLDRRLATCRSRKW